MAGVFIRGKGRRFRHTGTYTQERRPREDGGRDCSHKPRVSRECQGPPEARKRRGTGLP